MKEEKEGGKEEKEGGKEEGGRKEGKKAGRRQALELYNITYCCSYRNRAQSN